MDEVERIGPPITAIGDDPHWQKHTPQVWQAVAYKHTSMLFSIANFSTVQLMKSRPFQPIFVEALGAFSSALQLVRFGLGWDRGSKQFSHWRALGYPSTSPHLLVINHLLGSHVEHLENWWSMGHQSADNPLTSGGYDSLHLTGHWDGPINRRQESEYFSFTSANASHVSNHDIWPSNRMILETDNYLNWYQLLTHLGNEHHTPGQVIDVYCQPVGWLGRYSRSLTTRKWHCTTEEIHTWGHQR